MKKYLIPIAALILASPVQAEDAFSSLEEQMTGKEFTAAGLQKLSPEELAALNEWIRQRSLATLDAPRAGSVPIYAGQEDTRGFEIQQMQQDREPIESRIVGAFTGWDGKTVFELENGQIWEQADKDKFYIREVQNPAVRIEPAAFRTWRLSVEGYSSECRVERIQ